MSLAMTVATRVTHVTDLSQCKSNSQQQTQCCYFSNLGNALYNHDVRFFPLCASTSICRSCLSSRFADQVCRLLDLVRRSINQTKTQECFQIHVIPALYKVRACTRASASSSLMNNNQSPIHWCTLYDNHRKVANNFCFVNYLISFIQCLISCWPTLNDALYDCPTLQVFECLLVFVWSVCLWMFNRAAVWIAVTHHLMNLVSSMKYL